MDNHSEEVLKDILYKMKNDLGINLDDTWISVRIHQFLDDMWNAGYDNGLYDDDRLKNEYEQGYNNGYETGKQNAKANSQTDYESGYDKGYAEGDKDGYQRALSRFNNPDVG
jgi:hypothetical protein